MESNIIIHKNLSVTVSGDISLNPHSETKFLAARLDGWELEDGACLFAAFKNGSDEIPPALMAFDPKEGLYYLEIPSRIMRESGNWYMCVYKKLGWNSETGTASAVEAGRAAGLYIAVPAGDGETDGVTEYDVASAVKTILDCSELAEKLNVQAQAAANKAEGHEEATRGLLLKLTEQEGNVLPDNSKLTEFANKNLYNLGAYDTVEFNGDGTVTVTRRTGYAELGPEDVQSQAGKTAGGLYGFILKDKIGTQNFKSSISNAVENGWSSANPCIYRLDGGLLMLCIEADTADIGNGKKFLSENPITVQYETETPYTETVIENQPVRTLNRDGENWLGNEWGKGLNLLNPDNRLESSGFYPVSTSIGNVSDYVCYYAKISPNTTYSVTIPADHFVAFTSALPAQGVAIYNPLYKTSGSYNITSGYTAEYICFAVSSSDNKEIMLNEGPHAYPYQPYSGRIVRENELGTKVSKSGDTMTGNLITPGLQVSKQSSIEIGVEAVTPYIDFHYNNDLSDFTARIVEDSKGSVNVLPELRENGKRVYSPNNPPPNASVYNRGIVKYFDKLNSSVALNSSTNGKIELLNPNWSTYSKPTVLTVFGLETAQHGCLYISKDTDISPNWSNENNNGNNILAKVEGEQGYWQKQWLCCSVLIPPNVYPYVYGRYITKVRYYWQQIFE